MADRKDYYIHIDTSITTSDVEEAAPATQAGTQEAVTQKTAKASLSKGANAAVAIQMGKQALNWGVSNYGALTGDYQTQKQITAGIGLAASALTIAKSPVIGLALLASSAAISAANTIVQVAKSNREAELLRQRTQTYTTSGGRK